MRSIYLSLGRDLPSASLTTRAKLVCTMIYLSSLSFVAPNLQECVLHAVMVFEQPGCFRAAPRKDLHQLYRVENHDDETLCGGDGD